MTTLKKNVFFVLLLAILTGCAEKNGYYNEGEQSIIDNLCSSEWIRYYDFQDDIYCEKYLFKSNGVYTRTFIVYDQLGKEKSKDVSTYGWSFNDPSFSTIYLGSDKLITIKSLSSDKFCLYMSVYDSGSSEKEYIEFTHNQKEWGDN